MLTPPLPALVPPCDSPSACRFYDEIILSKDTYVANLPASIEAVFFLRNMDCKDAFDGPKCGDYARLAHQKILKHFSLSPDELPLLEFDLWNWKRPFRDTNPNPRPPHGGGGGDDALTLDAECTHELCGAFSSWFASPQSDEARRFYSMWGDAYERRGRLAGGCYDGQGVGSHEFFRRTLAGETCSRNWLAGAIGGDSDRPFRPPSPALLGFDESINEECSRLLGVEPWDDRDLNWKIANRCRDAQRNVLRLLTGRWSMCQNLEWQVTTRPPRAHMT